MYDDRRKDVDPEVESKKNEDKTNVSHYGVSVFHKFLQMTHWVKKCIWSFDKHNFKQSDERPKRINEKFKILVSYRCGYSFNGVGFYYLFKKTDAEKGMLLTAKTLGWIPLSNGGYDLQYVFMYGGRKIRANNVFSDVAGNKNFKNRYSPVIYYPGLGEHSQLLIRPNNFNDFSLPFPDILK